MDTIDAAMAAVLAAMPNGWSFYNLEYASYQTEERRWSAMAFGPRVQDGRCSCCGQKIEAKRAFASVRAASPIAALQALIPKMAEKAAEHVR